MYTQDGGLSMQESRLVLITVWGETRHGVSTLYRLGIKAKVDGDLDVPRPSR